MFKNSIDQSPKFLSTPSARRATRSVRGLVFFTWISIHALREEGDIASLACSSVNPSFLSTPSVRRATAGEDNDKKLGDYFYPRPPRGGRRECIVDIDSTTEISIHALREEGDGGIGPHPGEIEVISIHALREEGDVPAVTAADAHKYFYPRPPRGGRPQVPEQKRGSR